MNAGKDIPGSVIKYNLRVYAKLFKHVYIVDGKLTDEAKEFYSQFENVTAIDSPWKDSYVDQYRAWRDAVPKGEWVLYLDCDEIPSPELALYIASASGLAQSSPEDGTNTLCLPCVLYLTEDGISYAAAEGKPKEEYEGQWMKNILVLNDEHLDFHHFGSHVIPTHNEKEKGKYIPFPYYHMKSLESFVYNDVWQAYLDPRGQHYNPVDVNLFKMFTKAFKTTAEFKKATKEGKWNPAFQKFAWDRRHQWDNPVSRLAWVYFILEGHPMPEKDEGMVWDNVKNFVLDKESMDRYHWNMAKGLDFVI